MRIVVNTPSGNIGLPLVEALLGAGKEITIISRNPEKVAPFVARGARLVEGSIDDPAVLDRALTGASALFWLTPPASRPDFVDWAVTTARAAAEAVRKHDVKRVVVLSSLGAQSGRGTGPVSPLLEIEDAFRAAAPDVVALRAGFFMENTLHDASTIAKTGSIFSSVPADRPFPFVATKDIAAVAAEELLREGALGHRIRGVHGPADLTWKQGAEILSEALGRPVNYVEVTLDQVKAGMEGAGMPPFIVATYIEMYGAIRDGRMVAAEARSPETTTPTSLAEFARQSLRPAVEAATPKRIPFVAILTFKPMDPAERARLVPAEVARINELKKSGDILRGSLAQDRKRAFMEMSAVSAEAAHQALSTLPFYPWLDVELVELIAPL